MIMKLSLATGKVNCAAALPSNGTMITKPMTYLCQSTLKQPCSSSNTQYKSAPQYYPHPCNVLQYGAKIQMVEDIDNSPHLDKNEVKWIQQIVGSLLHLAQAVDSTLLIPQSASASEQSKATERTHEKINQLLDYCATNPIPNPIL
jgi:hypothetical protein